MTLAFWWLSHAPPPPEKEEGATPPPPSPGKGCGHGLPWANLPNTEWLGGGGPLGRLALHSTAAIG
jgi:hypothetical protein